MGDELVPPVPAAVVAPESVVAAPWPTVVDGEEQAPKVTIRIRATMQTSSARLIATS